MLEFDNRYLRVLLLNLMVCTCLRVSSFLTDTDRPKMRHMNNFYQSCKQLVGECPVSTKGNDSEWLALPATNAEDFFYQQWARASILSYMSQVTWVPLVSPKYQAIDTLACVWDGICSFQDLQNFPPNHSNTQWFVGTIPILHAHLYQFHICSYI